MKSIEVRSEFDKVGLRRLRCLFRWEGLFAGWGNARGGSERRDEELKSFKDPCS